MMDSSTKLIAAVFVIAALAIAVAWVFMETDTYQAVEEQITQQGEESVNDSEIIRDVENNWISESDDVEIGEMI